MNLLEMAMAAKMAGGSNGGSGGGGASSWNDLTDKPFGVTYSDTIRWDGNADGLQSMVYFVYPMVKISDAQMSADDIFVNGALREMTVTGVLPDGTLIEGYVSSAETAISGYDYTLMATAYDGSMENVPVGIIYTTEHSVESERGVWFVNMPESGYFTSLTITGFKCFEEIDPIDPKLLPEPTLLGEITVTNDDCEVDETNEMASLNGGVIKKIRTLLRIIEATPLCFCQIETNDMCLRAPVTYFNEKRSQDVDYSNITMTFQDDLNNLLSFAVHLRRISTNATGILAGIKSGSPLTIKVFKA